MKQIILLIIVLLFIIIGSSIFTYTTLKNKETFEGSHEYMSYKVFVANSTNGKGRGVFAKEDIQKGDIIEVAPIILEPKNKILKNSNIMQYVFFSDQTETEYAIAFGYASIYNHNDNNNAQWIVDKPNLKIIITALKNIRKGEEIFVSYGENYFKTRGTQEDLTKASSTSNSPPPNVFTPL